MENKTTLDLIEKIRFTDQEIVVSLNRDLIQPGCFHVNIRNLACNYYGHGKSHNFRKAVVKAYTEYSERKTFRDLSAKDRNIRSSSGFAGHSSFDSARENAVLEVIERDAFLNTWHGQIPPGWLSDRDVRSLNIPSAQLVLNSLHQFGLSFKLGVVAETEGVYTGIACLLSNPCSPIPIGLAIDTKAGRNLSSIFEDLLGSMSFVGTLLLSRLSHKRDIWDTVGSFQKTADHLEFYLDPKNKPDWFFESTGNVTRLSMPEIESVLVGHYPQTPIGEIFVVRAKSEKLQDYYIGKYSHEKINHERYSSIFNTDQIKNTSTHPLA